MSFSIDKLLDNDTLRNNDLSDNEDMLKNIMESLSNEIEYLNKLDDSKIAEELEFFYEKTYFNDKNEFEKIETHKENLLYIKKSYYIDSIATVPSEIEIDINIFKELKLDELIDIKNIEDGRDFKISFDNFRKILNNKTEEKEKWNQYNVVNTFANFFEIEENNIKFISNLSEYVDFTSKLENAVNYVSRGQKDCTYTLIPSLFRICSKDYDIHADDYETSFKQKIIYYDKEIKNKSAEELKGEGQHFGLPTNYLDFTEAHLISLLFAIEDYQYTQQHSIVYFVDSCNYNKETIGVEEKLINFSDENYVASTKKYSSRSFFIKLGNSNERIHFQKGCFLKTAYEDLKEFERKIKKHCKIVLINKDFKKDILKELFNLGITFENIYPDKDNVVKSIKFYYEEMKKEEYNG